MPSISFMSTEEGGTRTAKRLSPLEMLDLRRAVLARKKSFEMRNRTFNITYEGKTVWYSPKDRGFVPCGRIPIAKIEKYVEELEQ